MSKFNFSVYLNAYEDRYPSNAPSLNNFRWARDINSLDVSNPTNQTAQIQTGETLLLFSGLRTLTQDDTTEYSLALLPDSTSTYVLSWTGGTAPNFRTSRAIGIDATTQIITTVNGPLETFTSSPGTAASFTGQIPGLASPVTITANNIGLAGNTVVLSADGVLTLNQLIANWNTANPSNQITLTAGNGAQIPNAPLTAEYAGIITGTSTIVSITANNSGMFGNDALITGDGTSTINELIAAWNVDMPGNQITLTSGDGTQVPEGGAHAFYIGVGLPMTPSFTSITIRADNIGQIGNNVELVGDGSSNINTLIANWNIAESFNTISLTAGLGGQIPELGALFTLMNGVNPAVAQLAGGQDANINLTGGTAGTGMNLSSVQVGDYVTIGNLFNFDNQGTFQIIAISGNTFTISNPVAAPEGPIVLGAGFADQLQIYSAAGVQVGDEIMIGAPFSTATQGTYEITAVFPESVQFSSVNVLPEEGPLASELIIYSEAKTFIYLEADSALDVIVNGVNVGSIKPFVCINAFQPSLPPTILPGVFMFSSVIYSLSVQNSALAPSNMFFAAVE